MLRKRALERRSVGLAHEVGGELVGRFHDRLPYQLTGAQVRVIEEIERDLARGHPMHRLLQGDVGAGKTVVAMHRAKSLAEQVCNQPGDKILFTTFTRNLAEDIDANLAKICSVDVKRPASAHMTQDTCGK